MVCSWACAIPFLPGGLVWQRFSFVTPTRGEGGDSSDEDGSEEDEDEEDGDEEDEDFSGGNHVDGVGMSEAEERLVASFMNAGERRTSIG